MAVTLAHRTRAGQSRTRRLADFRDVGPVNHFFFAILEPNGDRYRAAGQLSELSGNGAAGATQFTLALLHLAQHRDGLQIGKPLGRLCAERVQERRSAGAGHTLTQQ